MGNQNLDSFCRRLIEEAMVGGDRLLNLGEFVIIAVHQVQLDYLNLSCSWLYDEDHAEMNLFSLAD